MARQLALCAIFLVGCALDPTIVVAPDAELAVYDRSEWKHWVDEDKDCQDARQEALIATTEVEPTYKTERRCKVVIGQWTDPYTGTVITEASKVDVDHVVALQDAHESGGFVWDRNSKSQFANDPANLLPVSASANRSKGSRGPDEWLPPLEGYRCEYIRKWVAIKATWDLASSDCEAARIEYMLKMCESGSVPPLPQ